MGIFSSKLDFDKIVYVEVNPEFEYKNGNTYNKKIKNSTLLKFFKSNKIDKKYLFSIGHNYKYKYSIKSISIRNTTIIYKIKYDKKKEEKHIKISQLSDYIKSAFYDMTNAGNPILLTKIKKDKIYIFVKESNVKVYQN